MWRPNPKALHRPAFLSLAEEIAKAIADHRLEPGVQLPTHRQLAFDLGLSTQTVSRAYAELTRRGLISGEIGRGSFVRPPKREPDPPYIPERLGEVIDLSILKPVCETMHLDHFKAGLAGLARELPPSTVLSFRPNVVFPRHRAIAVEWLRACGVEAAPSSVFLTNGATAGMTIALMTAAAPGSTVVTEEIGHHTLVPLASYLGLKLHGLPIDNEGVIPDALDRACRTTDVRALFVQPTVINPTATMMSAQRRGEIAEICHRRNILIIENDVLGPLVEKRPKPLAAIAPERTLYVTTFTKCVVPGLRIGYLIVPDHLMPAAANRHLVTNWMATPLLAELATRWIEDGTSMQLVRWQREALRGRHRIATEMLRGINHCSHEDSLHVWLPLDAGHAEEDFVSHARLQGVAIAPGASFFTNPEARKPAVRISLGSTTAGELRTGLKVVATLLHGDPEPVLLTV